MLPGRQGCATARIVNICGIYDALRSPRPFRPAFDHLKAMDILTLGDGRTQPEHFDPVFLATFRKNLNAFHEIFEAHAAPGESPEDRQGTA